MAFSSHRLVLVNLALFCRQYCYIHRCLGGSYSTSSGSHTVFAIGYYYFFSFLPNPGLCLSVHDIVVCAADAAGGQLWWG